MTCSGIFLSIFIPCSGTPCITSVQYCGGCSVLRRLFSTVGGSISTCGGIASVHVGDSISTAEAVQYCGGIASVLRRLFSTAEGCCSTCGG